MGEGKEQTKQEQQDAKEATASSSLLACLDDVIYSICNHLGHEGCLVVDINSVLDLCLDLSWS